MMQFEVVRFFCGEEEVVDMIEAVDAAEAFHMAHDVMGYDMTLARQTYGEEGYFLRFDGGEVWYYDDMFAGVGDTPRFEVRCCG